jgi:hypothetical protein
MIIIKPLTIKKFYEGNISVGKISVAKQIEIFITLDPSNQNYTFKMPHTLYGVLVMAGIFALIDCASNKINSKCFSINSNFQLNSFEKFQ